MPDPITISSEFSEENGFAMMDIGSKAINQLAALDEPARTASLSWLQSLLSARLNQPSAGGAE